MVKGLEASDSWSSTGDPNSHPTREQLLAPSRQTEVTVPAASTTPTLGSIFPVHPQGSGHWFQAVFLWPSSEGRHWAKSLKQNNSALLLHLSALTYLSTESYRGNKLLILTAISSTPASSGTPISVWSIRGLGSLSKLHTSTLLTSTKTGNIMATLTNLHSAQPTERVDLPSQYRQVLDNRGFRKAACLYTSLSSFTVIHI